MPKSRLDDGLFLEKSILENQIALVVASLANRFGVIDEGKGRALAAKLSEDMRLNTHDIDLAVGSLSGGNQQRVLIGRWLSIAPKVMLLHGPTVGVDVGSKDMIYRAMQALAGGGMGLIVISDDLPELLQNCDRILVMNGGRFVADLDAASTNDEEIYRAMLASTTEMAQ